jgi:hypothetical protein
LTDADPARVKAARTASSLSELPPPEELLEQVAEVVALELLRATSS